MTILDKIIFVADAIEPGRTGSDADKARKASENYLDEAIVYAMRIKSYYLKGKPLHPNSIKMLEKLKKKMSVR